MKDIATTNEKDLIKLLSEKREALRAFRFHSAGSKSKNVKEGRSLRKQIAQILTGLAERQNRA